MPPKPLLAVVPHARRHQAALSRSSLCGSKLLFAASSQYSRFHDQLDRAKIGRPFESLRVPMRKRISELTAFLVSNGDSSPHPLEPPVHFAAHLQLLELDAPTHHFRTKEDSDRRSQYNQP